MKIQLAWMNEINTGKREFDDGVSKTNELIMQCFERFAKTYRTPEQAKRTKSLHAAFIVAFENQGAPQMTLFNQALEDFIEATRPNK